MQHNLGQQKKIEQKDIAPKSSNLQPAFTLYKTKHRNQKEALSRRPDGLKAKDCVGGEGPIGFL